MMSSHKTLKSVAHNFGHSFISLMNYIDDDYFLGHLLKQVRATNLSRLEVDLLKGTAKPEQLLNKLIRDSIRHWNSRFSMLIVNSGSSMDFVSSASMVIEFDLSKTRPYSNGSSIAESSFICEVRIIDDRGKEYQHKHKGWWYPES